MVIKYIICTILLSIVSAYFFWGQSIDLGFRSTTFFLGLIYYFLLLEFKPGLKKVENLLLFFCGVYIIAWLIAVAFAPQVLFSIDPERIMDESRGFFRINLEGYGILVITFFLSLNKLITERKSLWLLLIIPLFIIIILHLIRQVIVAVIIISVLYIFKNSYKALVISVLSLVAAFFIPLESLVSSNKIVDNLIGQTVNQYERNKNNEGDIRARSFKFYTTEFSEFCRLFYRKRSSAQPI